MPWIYNRKDANEQTHGCSINNHTCHVIEIQMHKLIILTHGVLDFQKDTLYWSYVVYDNTSSFIHAHSGWKRRKPRRAEMTSIYRFTKLLLQGLKRLHLVFNWVASNGSIILSLTTYMKYGASPMLLLKCS